MPQIGPLEILVVLMVALIVFGPEKLPTIARQIGRAANELRRMASEVKDEFEDGLSMGEEDDERPRRKVPPPAEVDREGIDPDPDADPRPEDGPEDNAYIAPEERSGAAEGSAGEDEEESP